MWGVLIFLRFYYIVPWPVESCCKTFLRWVWQFCSKFSRWHDWHDKSYHKVHWKQTSNKKEIFRNWDTFFEISGSFYLINCLQFVKHQKLPHVFQHMKTRRFSRWVRLAFGRRCVRFYYPLPPPFVPLVHLGNQSKTMGRWLPVANYS